MRFFFLAINFCSLLISSLEARTVYLMPIPGLDLHRTFYDYNGYRDEVTKPFTRLREELEKANYVVKFSGDAANLDEDFVAIINFNESSSGLHANLKQIPKERCFIFLFEPPFVLPALYDKSLRNYYGKIFTMFDHMVDNRDYFKFCYPQPRLEMIQDVTDFQAKKLCTLINSNKDYGGGNPRSLYAKRRAVIDFFTKNHPEDFDLYGVGWHGYPLWKGTVANKWGVYKNYKFSFCYENTGEQLGYITEKIFDSMVGGCVPIYLGASNIQDYVSPNCFIDRRDFSSEEELYQFLQNMDRETYQEYLDAIKIYLSSPQAQQFSIDSFINLILTSIAEL